MFSKKKKKTMKKILILFAIFFIGILSAKASYSFSYTYQGKTLYYEIISSTTVRVTYATYDSNYVSGNVTIPSQIKKATYHNTQTYSVTSIGSSAFSGCSGLTSITIPNSVTSIDSSAFKGCSSLDTVTINSNSVCKKFWGGYLDTITKPRILIIGNSVTSIGDGAFKDCTSLTNITIPRSVASIGEYAFFGCSDLTSITIPKFVDSIGNYAFSNCNSLTSIIVNYNTRYDSRDNCNAIIETTTNTLIVGCKNTIIPNTVTSIGNSAFSGCSGLTSVTIPNLVTSIGNSAFSGCSGLKSIIVKSGNPIFDSRDNCNAIIETSTNNLIVGCKNTIIPNSVTKIQEHAFSGCSDLRSIKIPSSVTTIDDNAFSNCNSLDTVIINSNNTCYNFWVTPNDTITNPRILIIGNSVTSIYEYAFTECNSLISISIPASVTSIGNYAFRGCSNIGTIYSRNTNPPIIDNSSTFKSVSRSAKLYVPNGSVEAYKQANVWKEFYNIEESDFANIDNVGIQDIDLSSTISLYPNPADKEVYLTLDNTDLGNTKAVIYDIQGRVIKAFEIKENENNVKLDISSLAKGTYTIMISNDKTRVTKKLIKR